MIGGPVVDKFNEQINKKDLELILEVNKKAIEIQTSVADQNEEILTIINELLTNQKTFNSDQAFKIDKIIKQSEDTNRDIFKIQVLFLTGLLSLVIQVIQLWKK